MVGIAPAVFGLGGEHLDRWLAAGKAGEMEYMTRQAPARHDPNLVLPGVRSVVAAALGYRTAEPVATDCDSARISRYAWNEDYHQVLREKLNAVCDRLRMEEPEIGVRAVVDSAPVMERDYAQLAGLGWIGKNTLLLNKRLGSWFFLGAILVDRELEYDLPNQTNHCGTCTRCLDECPTQAFNGPYQLDPRKCISYLTIELRTAIPETLREGIGDWIFGCDVCQDVCPWNRRAPVTDRIEFKPHSDANPIGLVELLEMDEAAFRRRFRNTPLFRAKRSRVLRNACIVAVNQRSKATVPILRILAESESDSIIRETAIWALQQFESNSFRVVIGRQA